MRLAIIESGENMTKNNTLTASQVKNTELVRMINDLKQQATGKKQEKMLQQLLNATLLAPAVIDPQIRNKKPAGPVQVKFMMLNTKEGQAFFPLFTDMEEAKKMNAQNQNVVFLARTIKDYEEIFRSPVQNVTGLVINPMGQNIVIPLPLAKLLAEGKTPATAPRVIHPQEAVFSEPQLYPTALANAVYDICRTLPEVQYVWLKQASAPGVVAYALIVDAGKPNEKVKQAILEAAEKESRNRQVVIFDYTKQLEEKALKDAYPLYNKEMEI